MERPIPPLGDMDAAMQGRGESVVRPPTGRGPNPRKPWLALLLGIFVPSAGFAYVGRLGLFIAMGVGVFGSIFRLGRVGMLQTLPGVWGVTALVVAFAIACIVLPWRFARAERSYRLRWYNCWYVYPLLVVLHVPGLVLLQQREAWIGYGSYRVSSTSMAPTVDAGDFIVVDTRASTLASLHVGDVVIVESEQKPGEMLLRRIVAAGGQHVVIGEDGVRVDGVLQTRTHLQGSDMLPSKWMKYTDVELASDELYLMGDNRGNSVDSRLTGPATRDFVRGKAAAVWWPPASARLGSIPTP
jgi:signal peptidase I